MINTKQVHRINDDKLMTGKPNMGTRGGETQDMGNTGLTLLPPPERCVPHRTPSNGGGWALWRPQGTRRKDRRPPGRRPFRDPRRSGELRRPWRVSELGRPWRVRLRGRGPSPHPGLYGWSPTTPPPPNFLGESRGSRGHLGALGKRGHLGALGKRGHLGVLGKRVHWRALSRIGHRRVLSRSGHRRALSRSGHRRALSRSGHRGALARSGH